MEKIIVDKDVEVAYVQATTFPDGIMAAFNELYRRVGREGREFMAISRPENGQIVYRAAVVVAPGVPDDMPRWTVRKGVYISEMVYDFMKAPQQIGMTYRKLLDSPGIDPQGYCLERYPNEQDVQCMVLLKASEESGEGSLA